MKFWGKVAKIVSISLIGTSSAILVTSAAILGVGANKTIIDNSIPSTSLVENNCNTYFNRANNYEFKNLTLYSYEDSNNNNEYGVQSNAVKTSNSECASNDGGSIHPDFILKSQGFGDNNQISTLELEIDFKTDNPTTTDNFFSLDLANIDFAKIFVEPIGDIKVFNFSIANDQDNNNFGIQGTKIYNKISNPLTNNSINCILNMSWTSNNNTINNQIHLLVSKKAIPNTPEIPDTDNPNKPVPPLPPTPVPPAPSPNPNPQPSPTPPNDNTNNAPHTYEFGLGIMNFGKIWVNGKLLEKKWSQLSYNEAVERAHNNTWKIKQTWKDMFIQANNMMIAGAVLVPISSITLIAGIIIFILNRKKYS